MIIVLGLFLRLVWIEDMEWKWDEQQLYSMAHGAINKCWSLFALYYLSTKTTGPNMVIMEKLIMFNKFQTPELVKSLFGIVTFRKVLQKRQRFCLININWISQFCNKQLMGKSLILHP